MNEDREKNIKRLKIKKHIHGAHCETGPMQSLELILTVRAQALFGTLFI